MEFLFTDLKTFLWDLFNMATITGVLYYIVEPIFIKEKEND